MIANKLPAESLRQRKKRLTRRRICDAAAELFVSQGYANTTVDAIAALAGISKPTLFNYFPSKITVLHALIDVMDEQFVRYISDELNTAKSTEQRLRDLLRRSARYINRTPELTRLILVEGFGAIGNLDQAKARFKLLHEAMGRLILAGREQGDVRQDYAAELLVQMLVGSYLYALLNWLSIRNFDLGKSLEQTAGFLAEAIAVKR